MSRYGVNGGKAERLGVFGGTFDPPHVGHVLALSDAADRLSLSRVLWVPAFAQPLKAGMHADARHRRRMVELTIAGDPRFEIEAMELDRGGKSYTVDTLRALRDRTAAELYLLMGADGWRTFGAWRVPHEIAALARIVVLERDDGVVSPGADAPLPGVEPVRLPTRRVDVTASEIRQRVRDGKPIRGFVTESVERYIAENSLYR